MQSMPMAEPSFIPTAYELSNSLSIPNINTGDTDRRQSNLVSTEIKNLATVSYEDSSGNSYTAQSNEAVVTVAQVYSAAINSTDTNLTASPGQPVDLSYTLENTGNGTDTFVLSAADGIVGGDSIDADSIAIYEDLNNNGQADAGEPVISSVALTAGEIKSIVVRTDVPTSALGGDDLGITLTAQAEEGTGAAVADSVTDLTTGKGPDTLDGTVESSTKSSVHNPATSEIEYTVTIRNNGNADATSVMLQDAIPENTTYVANSATTSGLITSNGDTVPATAVLDETIDAIDFNGDGDTTDTAVDGLSAIDAVLPPNATVTVTYTVSYDPAVIAGGTSISNIAYVIADVDGDGTPDAPGSTNQVVDLIDDTLLVSIADTGDATGGDGVNDGLDDDGLNDIQYVDSVSAGEAIVFTNIVTNGGNADDVLELSVNNVSFPAGTVFTFWNAAGTVQLSDSNGVFGVDAGLVAAGQSETITVVAQLPATVNGVGDYDAVVTVSSASDPAVTDTVTERLAAIDASTIDIHNASGGTLGIDENPIGAPDYSAVFTKGADVNSSVIIPLYIDNDGDAPNSFQLSAGSVYDAGTDTVSGLPAGWVVEFFLSDGAGQPTGASITATPVIPGQTTDFEIIAVVSVPDQAQADGVITRYFSR